MSGNHRKWLRDTLAGRPWARVPYNFMFSPPAEQRLKEHYGADNVLAALDLPMALVGPADKPLYANPEVYGETITDQFRVVWSTNAIDRGSPVGPPLREPSLAGYEFPDPDDPARFAHLAEQVERLQDRFIIGVVGDLWERATFMRGMEALCLDVRLHRGFVGDLLEGICEYNLRTFEHLAELPIDGIFISDDYGTQRGLVIGRRDWRELVRPRLARIYDAAKARGLVVMHHTCGCVVELVPDLIEMGLDILHPIQPEAMDIFALKRQFGSDLTFCGGIGTQELLPHATPEQVRAEVLRTLEAMAQGGRYILEPGITLQADVPTENMVAMIEAVREYRLF
ncbi:MAG: uroporphyrinogen decarboxylase family protein [Armatimonadota bacterium]